jgi:hypothetical protein
MGSEQQNETSSSGDEPAAGDAARKVWWFRQPIPIDRFTGWLVAWTALLFVATVINAMILGITDVTLRDTLEANNRAWLAITGAYLDNTPEADLQVLAHLTYKNVGQSPALQINHMMIMQRADAPDKERGAPIPKDDVCSKIADAPGSAVFPGVQLGTAIPFGREAVVDKAIIDEGAVLFWRGCFKYVTYKKIHTTQFCYWLRHNGPSWHWQDCGVKAD